MTFVEKMKTAPCLRIPIWVITALIPVFITMIGGLIYQARTQQNIINSLEYHDEKIKDISIELSDKVGRQEYQELRTYLMRLEDKVDRLIDKL